MRAMTRAMASLVVILAVFSVSTIGLADDELTVPRSDEWREQLSAAVESEVARSSLLSRAAEITLELVQAETLPEDPSEAARYVVSLAARAEDWLRQGVPEPMVRLMLSRQIGLSASQGYVPAHELDAPRRLRGRGQGGPPRSNREGMTDDDSKRGPWRGGGE